VTTHRAFPNPKPEVHCNKCYDARIAFSQDEFLEKKFGVVNDNGKGKVTSLPGGFAFSTPGTKKFEVALTILRFTLKHFTSITTYVVLGHDECGWFRENGESGKELADLLEYKKIAKAEIKRHFPHRKIKVIAFFGRFTSPKQKKAKFKKV
jgi:hypothetical protein